MLEDAEIDRSELKHRRRALNAPGCVIVSAYSAIVLQLRGRGINGPMARRNAITWTADAVTKMTGAIVSPRDVEEAIEQG